MKIYFFGGSFDPPHKAHKSIYKYCLNLCDKFIFFPTGQSPQKSQFYSKDSDRIEMLKSLIDNEDLDKVVIDTFEMESDFKPNYTIDTIMYLKNKFKSSDIYMVIGGDQYNNLNNWKDYNKIISEVHIVCFNRQISSFKNKSINNIDFIDFDYNISSTEIRNKVSCGKINEIKDCLTKEVNHLIINNDLYMN